MAEKQQRYGVWSVVWRVPHKPRPDGFPAVMLRIRIPLGPGEGAGQCPQEIHECWEEMRHYGYCVSWYCDAPPARTLSLETKQRIRRSNLWKRLLKRYPMFIERFYQDGLNARPEYYGSGPQGEFADVSFMQTQLGYLKMHKEKPPSSAG